MPPRSLKQLELFRADLKALEAGEKTRTGLSREALEEALKDVPHWSQLPTRVADINKKPKAR